MSLVMPGDDGAVATLRRASVPLLLRRVPEPLRARLRPAPELVLDPTVSVLLQCDRAAAAVPVLALELAWRRLLGAPLVLDTPCQLWSLSRDVLFAPAQRTVIADGLLILDGERVPLDHTALANAAFPAIGGAPPGSAGRGGGAGLGDSQSIDGELRFAARFDPNPLALVEAHPDKQGNALSLGDRPVDDWLLALRAALALVDRHLPALAAELRLLTRLIIPVGFDAERHLSASYREYVGAIYLTLHPDPVVLAEALVHEFQHNKLNLLSWHYPILENGYDFLYRSPVRPDPRPLMGILLAAHAFVPVAELYRRLVDASDDMGAKARLAKRLAGVIARNDEALAVLAQHAVPAPAGARVLAELRTLHAAHDALGVTRERDVAHEG